MFLDYFALVVLLLGLTLVFYGFIYVHDLPHKIAKKRHHPHEEAIHVACWLSLFTLHAIWPIVYIWACSHRKALHPSEPPPATAAQEADQARRLALLEARLLMLEGAKEPTTTRSSP